MPYCKNQTTVANETGARSGALTRRQQMEAILRPFQKNWWKFIGIELNPEYVDQAMEFLEKQSLNSTSKRRIRYDANKHADQLAFFEAASQRRVLS